MKLSDIKKLPPEKLFVVVDGSSYLFRAFYAPNLNSLTSPAGNPTGAIYGVVNMLGRLTEQMPVLAQEGREQCFSALIFDEKGGSFRNEIYPAYKANRGATPDDLISQIAPMKKLVTDKGWMVMSIAGVEADDVIATLIKQAKAQGLICVIVTGDKDFAQLVDEQVFLYDSMREKFLDVAGVEEKFGVPPSKIKDYLTLIGDSSDNIPGVHKVGPKTAVKWLCEYDSLAGIVNVADNLSGVIGKNFREAIPQFPLTQELITLKEDVTLPYSFDQLKVQPENTAQLVTAYSELGFRKFLAEINNAEFVLQNPVGGKNLTKATTPPVKKLDDKVVLEEFIASNQDKYKYEFETVLSYQQLDDWIEKINNSSLTGFDTETTGLSYREHELVGISLAVSEQKACYIPLAHEYNSTISPLPEQLPRDEVLAKLKPWLENPQFKKCGHNLKFDRHFLAKYNIKLGGIDHDSLFFVAADNKTKRYDLETAANYYLDRYGISFKDVVANSLGEGANKKNIAGVPINLVTVYACEDAVFALMLSHIAEKKIAKDEQLSKIYALEMRLSEILYKMENRGIVLDSELLNSHSQDLLSRCQELTQKAHSLAGEEFNLASPKQIQAILFEKMGIKSRGKTAKGALSTDEEVLEKLAEDYPIAKVLLEYRQLSKLNNTYAGKLPTMVDSANGRIHTSFNQVGVITGRLASNEPNVQNIPIKTPEGRKIRKAFISDKNWQIISADYSQVELRVMAHFADDETMISAFEQGVDIHKRTAAEIFRLHIDEVNEQYRRYAKAINFGLIYGMSAFGLAKSIDISRTEAQVFIDRYFARYPKIFNFMQDIKAQAEKNGFVETIMGRKINIDFSNARTNQHKQALGRFAINAPIQGSAADIIKLAMIEVDKWLTQENLQTKLLLQVHDELVFESPDNEIDLIKTKIAEVMVSASKQLMLKVPLEVNVGAGDNWDVAH